MKSVFVVAALLAATLFGEALGSDKEAKTYTVDLSNFMDRAIPYMSKFIIDQKVDPMPLPNEDRTFWIPHPITVVWKAKFGLRSGALHSLSALHRQGKTLVTYKDKVLTVDTGVGFDKLMALYDYFLDLSYLRIDGHTTITPKSLDVGIKLQFDASKYKFDLETFKVRSVGTIDVDLRGNALIDWVTKPLTNFIVGIFQGIIVWAVEGSVKNTIQDYLNDFASQLPHQSYGLEPLLKN